jgi:hypothetical protein
MMRSVRYASVMLSLLLGMMANPLTAWAASTGAQAVQVSTAKKVSKKAAPAPQKVPPSLQVQGKIKAITRPPRPRTVPYDSAIIALHLVDVKAVRGKLPKTEILVFAWGMRNNKWTRAASYRVGQTITLSLQPWEKVERKYGGYNRIDLEGDAVFSLDPYWGEIN